MASDPQFRDQAEQDWLTALGTAIRHAREAARLTQTDAAERAGLHNTYLNRVEHGRANLSALALHRLATALETDPQALLPPLTRAHTGRHTGRPHPAQLDAPAWLAREYTERGRGAYSISTELGCTPSPFTTRSNSTASRSVPTSSRGGPARHSSTPPSGWPASTASSAARAPTSRPSSAAPHRRSWPRCAGTTSTSAHPAARSSARAGNGPRDSVAAHAT